MKATEQVRLSIWLQGAISPDKTEVANLTINVAKGEMLELDLGILQRGHYTFTVVSLSDAIAPPNAKEIAKAVADELVDRLSEYPPETD